MKAKISRFRLHKKYFTDVMEEKPIALVLSNGQEMHGTSMRHIDHPEFTKLREKLGKQGYIQIERGWHNGDRVLKPFYLNGFKFEKGDKFLSAIAMSVHMESKKFYDSTQHT